MASDPLSVSPNDPGAHPRTRPTGEGKDPPAADRVELRRVQDALVEAEQARERFEFLAEASTRVGESLDFEATLASIAQLAVPRVGRWCAVYLVREDGELRRLASAHVDPAMAELMRELAARFPVNPSPEHPVRRVIATGEPIITPETPPGEVDRFATAPEHAAILRQLGHTSSLIVPLTARGQTLGALSLGPDTSGRYPEWALATAVRLGRIAALAIDNARLYREAQEAIRTRDDFLASATHDLKTPLTAISGLAQAMERRASRVPPPEGERLQGGLAKINVVTHRMAALINELMDVARLRMGRRLALELHQTDLVALARQMIAEAQVTSAKHQLSVETELDSLVGMWDRFRLERVLGNLLANAIKYSPAGGEIAVSLKREQRNGEPWALLSVRDRGMGIPAPDLPRIFERFHRGRNVLGRIRGAGIGLFGARQIVQLHGGTIWADSQEGLGSTFTVALPLVAPDASTAQV